MSSDLSFTGVIHGNKIELDHPPGLGDGQRVIVNVQPLPAQQSSDGIRNSIGGWSDAPEELDDFLEWNRRQRKAGRPEPGS